MPGISKRSLIVFSYSARVSRRTPVRGPPCIRACSAATSESRSHFVTAAASFAAGRAFFFGGISPLAMRSCTFTHAAKFSAFVKSVFNAVRSRLPFFSVASWQSAQCFSKNACCAPAPVHKMASDRIMRMSERGDFMQVKGNMSAVAMPLVHLKFIILSPMILSPFVSNPFSHSRCFPSLLNRYTSRQWNVGSPP